MSVVRFSKDEMELMHKILTRVKEIKDADLSSKYIWIDDKLLTGLILRFKLNINDEIISNNFK